jgi:hypothetical protein
MSELTMIRVLNYEVILATCDTTEEYEFPQNISKWVALNQTTSVTQGIHCDACTLLLLRKLYNMSSRPSHMIYMIACFFQLSFLLLCFHSK